eukprot:SAG11_NODE_7011_length_1208_cov_95.322813_1_plen_395_part_10
MSVYPRNLSNFLNRLSGYNKNNVKLNVLGSGTANHGDIIQVELPTNSIVDLSSLAWSFNFATIAQTGNAAAQIVIPTNIESIIHRLAAEVNGQTLVNMTNYNTLFHALLYSTGTEDYIRSRKVAQTNSDTVADAGDVDTLIGAAAAANRDHVIDTWLGFLGSAKPNFIDTSLLGNVRITITLTPGTELLCGAAANAAATERSYTVSDQNFSVDVISIGDGIYDSMVDQMLASGRPIEVPFKNYFSYTSLQANSGDQMNFNVASQSIDRLWATARANDAVNGYNLAVAPAKAVDQSAAHTTAETATAAPFTFSNYGTHSFQFQVNNTMYPNWGMSKLQEMYQHTRLALGDQGNMLSGGAANAPEHYRDNYFVFAVSLEHHTDSDERFLSGIDTRGA